MVTLAVDPRIAADIGWQLSFAAVLGILAARRARCGRRSRGGSARGGWRGTLAEGAAMTIAATLATAPLIAFHFESLSTTTLFANLLALPAVAPAMWLGMLAAIGGQVPGFPVGLLNAVDAPLLAYIAQVAAWCGSPSWAYLHVRLGGIGLLASYLALSAAALGIPILLRRRRIASLRRARRPPIRGARRFVPLTPGKTLHRSDAAWGAAVCFALAALVCACGPGGRRRWASRAVRPADLGARHRPGRRDPAAARPGAGGSRRRRAARRRAGGEARAMPASSGSAPRSSPTTSPTTRAGSRSFSARFPVARLLYAPTQPPRCEAEAAAAGAEPGRIAAGGSIGSGRLRLEVLWPPPELLAEPLSGADPNQLALVILARWRRFSMLLTADAEAEEVPIDPGPVDVLKVAHHGSDDAGLGALLDRIPPKLAVISVGAGNSYGHPTAGTLGDARRARGADPAHGPGRHGRHRRYGRRRSRSSPGG